MLNMERQIVAVTFKVLSALKPLVTPDARAKALAVMNDNNLSYGSFLRKILEIEDAMWTDWHWHQAPDDVIHPDKSVPHCPLTNQSLFRRAQCLLPPFFFSRCIHLGGRGRAQPIPLFVFVFAGHDEWVKQNWGSQYSLQRKAVNIFPWLWHEDN